MENNNLPDHSVEEPKVVSINSQDNTVIVNTNSGNDNFVIQPQVVKTQVVNTQPQVINTQVVNTQPQVINTQVVNTQPQVVKTQVVKTQPQVVNTTGVLDTNQTKNLLNQEIKNESKKEKKPNKKMDKMVVIFFVIIGLLISSAIVFYTIKTIGTDKVFSKINDEISYGSYSTYEVELPSPPEAYISGLGEKVGNIIWNFSLDNEGNAIEVYTTSIIEEENVEIPSVLNGHKVIEIGNPNDSKNIFNNNGDNIKNVIVPEGIEIIGGFSFSYLPALESITIGNTVKYIYGFAFAYSPRLSKMNSEIEGTVILPTSLLGYDDYLFVENEKINKFEFPETIDYINKYTFAGCSGFYDVLKTESELVISGQYKYILKGAFQYNLITKLTFEEGVKYVSGFEYSYNLEEINFPKSLEAIEENAFSAECALKKINMKSNLKYLGRHALWSEESLSNGGCYIDINNYISFDRVKSVIE